MNTDPTIEELEAQIGDGEPTPKQYLFITRCAYRSNGIHFMDSYKDGARTVRCYIGKIAGEGPSTGHAFWAYRKALAAATLDA